MIYFKFVAKCSKGQVDNSFLLGCDVFRVDYYITTDVSEEPATAFLGQ